MEPTSFSVTRPDVVLRAEAGILLVLLVHAYARYFPHHWIFFALLFLFPDVSLLGFVKGQSRTAAVFYNLLHTYAVALLAGIWAWSAGAELWMRFSLVWLAHIAFDRLLGYGLKYPGSFRTTHIQRVSSL
jgi:hypothetical protein